jgi:ABC-2 type transport system permease protein
VSATVFTILAADVRSGWNFVVRGGGRRRAAVVVAPVVALPLMVGAFFGGGAAARAGADAASLLGAGFTTMVTVVLLLNVSTVITAFFADRALLLLALAPVRTRDVFLARLVSASVPFWLVAPVLFALVVGYGAGRGAGAGYYAAAVLAIALSAAATVSLLVALLSLVLRVVPARRARDVANLLAALLGVAVYVGWYGVVGGGSARSLRQGLQPLATTGRELASLPTAWPGSALAALADGDVAGGLARLGLLLALTAAIIGLAWVGYRRALVVGVGVYGEAGAVRPRRPVRRARRGAAGAGAGTGAARPVLALVRKDVVTMRRDMRLLAGMLPGLALAIVYPLLFARFPTPPRGPGSASEIVFWVGMSGTLFVPFMTSVVIALPAVGLEKRGMQLLLLSGTSARTIIRAKLSLALGAIVAIGAIDAVVSGLIRGAHDARLLVVFLAVSGIAAGTAAIGVGAGALAPNFDGADPRKAVRLEGILIFFVVAAVFNALVVGALVLAIVAAYQSGLPAAVLAVIAGGLLLAAAAASVGMVAAGIRSLSAWRPDPDA